MGMSVEALGMARCGLNPGEGLSSTSGGTDSQALDATGRASLGLRRSHTSPTDEVVRQDPGRTPTAQLVEAEFGGGSVTR